MVVVIAVLLHLSCDIGVCYRFHDLKVSAVVASTWREWRHRINSYLRLSENEIFELFAQLSESVIFEQFAKAQHPEKEKEDDDDDDPGTEYDLRGSDTGNSEIVEQFAKISTSEILERSTKLSSRELFEQCERIVKGEAIEQYAKLSKGEIFEQYAKGTTCRWSKNHKMQKNTAYATGALRSQHCCIVIVEPTASGLDVFGGCTVSARTCNDEAHIFITYRACQLSR